MNAEIDNFPVSELQNRSNIGIQAVYNRLEALSIKPNKEGNRSYITADQVRLLDDLHSHIKAGGTMTNFTPGSIERVNRPVSPVGASSLPLQAANFEELVRAIAAVIKPTEPLQYMEVLERAAEKEWLLSTSEVRALIGVKPKTKKGEDTYKRGSWLFVKSGKIGGQTAWRVTKDN